MLLAPIVIFTYNRPKYTERLINSLIENQLANKSEVFIYSDGYKGENDREKVLDVRKYLRSIENSKYFNKLTIYESEINKGLAQSVINGATEIINEYGKVIVLEDDLILANSFLMFMNKALNYYEKNENIWSISGFSSDIKYLEQYKQDVFFSKRARSWSWATWKDRWDTVDWNVNSYSKFKFDFKQRKAFNNGGRDMAAMLDRQQVGVINSWAIRWCYNQFCQDKYNVQPTISLVSNGGQDGSGTNCNIQRETNKISKGITNHKFVHFKYDARVDFELAKKKKVPIYKLVGSYIVYVLLQLKIKI
ncbi:MAG: glycosyltransferase [Clostridia bacterium]